MKSLLLSCAVALPAAVALENATFDSAGGLTALIDAGSAFPVHARLVAVFPGGGEVELQPHDQRTPITREGLAHRWSGTATAPNGMAFSFTAAWDVAAQPAAEYTVAHPGDHPALVRSIDYVVDLPRSLLLGGKLEPAGVALPTVKPADAVIHAGEGAELRFTDATGSRRLALTWDRLRPFTVTDRWDGAGRSYRVRVQLQAGSLGKEAVRFAARFQFEAAGVVAPRVRLGIDPQQTLQPFDGFGGNYCWGTENAVTAFTLANLRLAWSRHELKAILWDQQRAAPGPQLTADFERIRGLHQAGVPWILSLWRLPERFYTDPDRAPPGTFGRKIAGERWPEFLELIGSYLQHLKTNYGAEPALISFNEPDLGVNIGLTAEEHREAVKRIGSHLAQRGFRTKFLLGDTANPRDTHKYVLATAADAEAMRHVGAVSFHSWGNGTPEQYRAWAEVAAWLQLPLLVAEAGTDPGSWRNRTFDSYAYGLDEARQTQELLRYAQPRSSLYWQFTADYALARIRDDGMAEPTGRFWLMKQFTDLTPHHSVGVATTSDRAEVLLSAFARGRELVVHVLNTGPACTAEIGGLPPGNWRVVTTTETAGFQETPLTAPAFGDFRLPARSLVTLVRDP